MFGGGGQMPGIQSQPASTPSTPNANSFPGMQIGQQNSYTYDGPKISYNLNSASNLRQYNLQEYVYGYGSDAKNNKKSKGNGSNGSNGSSGLNNGSIISDIENLPTIDYILIAGALIILVMLI